MTDLGLNTDTNVQVRNDVIKDMDKASVEVSERDLYQLYAGLILFFGTLLTVTFSIYTRDTLCGAILEGGAILLAWFVATQPSSKD